MGLPLHGCLILFTTHDSKPIIPIHNRACAVNISSVLTFLSSLLNFSKTTNCTHLINSYSFVVFEKFSLCLLTPNCTKIHVNTTTKWTSLTSFSFFSLQIKTSLRMFKTSTKLGTPIHSKIFILLSNLLSNLLSSGRTIPSILNKKSFYFNMRTEHHIFER